MYPNMITTSSEKSDSSMICACSMTRRRAISATPLAISPLATAKGASRRTDDQEKGDLRDALGHQSAHGKGSFQADDVGADERAGELGGQRHKDQRRYESGTQRSRKVQAQVQPRRGKEEGNEQALCRAPHPRHGVVPQLVRQRRKGRAKQQCAYRAVEPDLFGQHDDQEQSAQQQPVRKLRHLQYPVQQHQYTGDDLVADQPHDYGESGQFTYQKKYAGNHTQLSFLLQEGVFADGKPDYEQHQQLCDYHAREDLYPHRVL